MDAVIKVENLTHTYSVGTPFEKTAIHDINVEFYPGELVAVIGHTGSGKSTFMQHMDGLLAPTSGTVYCDGEDIFATKEATRDVRFKVGLVFQYPEYQLFEETVYKDIAFGPKNMKLSEAEVDERVREAAGFVGIDEALFERSPLELSGGQKQRIAIAGVIAMRPKCIVLDEPTAMLDPQGRREVLATIRRLNRENHITAVLITHHMPEAVLADRVVVMTDGGILTDGTPKEVFTQVELLRAAGLTVPETTMLLYELRQAGFDLPLDALSVEECAQTLRDFLTKA